MTPIFDALASLWRRELAEAAPRVPITGRPWLLDVDGERRLEAERPAQDGPETRAPFAQDGLELLPCGSRPTADSEPAESRTANLAEHFPPEYWQAVDNASETATLRLGWTPPTFDGFASAARWQPSEVA